MLLKLCATLAVFVLIIECRKLKNHARTRVGKIVGGQKASRNYPYQLSLQTLVPNQNRSSHICGAVILSENFFLTAAHCIQDQNISQLSVLAGVMNLMNESKGSRHPIDVCLIHPDYIVLNTSDIALCKLKLPFVFSENIGKVHIDGVHVGDKVNCTLTGWGSISMFRWLPIPFYSLFAYPTDLHQEYFLTMTNEACVNKSLKVDDTQICAFKQFGQGACAG